MSNDRWHFAFLTCPVDGMCVCVTSNWCATHNIHTFAKRFVWTNYRYTNYFQSEKHSGEHIECVFSTEIPQLLYNIFESIRFSYEKKKWIFTWCERKNVFMLRNTFDTSENPLSFAYGNFLWISIESEAYLFSAPHNPLNILSNGNTKDVMDVSYKIAFDFYDASHSERIDVK